MRKGEQKIKLNERESEPEIWNHDVLEYSRKGLRVCVVVHPISAETELALGDAGPEAFLGVGETERAVLGHEGGVDVVHILGVFRGERTASGEA